MVRVLSLFLSILNVPRIRYLLVGNVFFHFKLFCFFLSMFWIFLWNGAFCFENILLLGDMVCVVPFDNIFPKKSRQKKTKRHVPIYYLFLWHKMFFLNAQRNRNIKKKSKNVRRRRKNCLRFFYSCS